MRGLLSNRVACLAALLLLLGATAVVAAGATSPAVTVSDAWIRWLPANLPAGGYLTLRNDSDRPATLTAVSSPDYDEITLHRTSLQANVNTMQPVQRIAIPPHQSVSFAASGYHIMLEHATRPLQPGDRVSMMLHFDDGSTLTVPFELRTADAGAPP
jgi:copper(I)-binding protein